ncbi:MAG: hypothetical protein ACE5GW_10110 [Planctomycetota bacterium]
MTRNKMLEEARAATPRMTGRPPPLLAALFLLGGILWCRAACAGEETTRVPLDPALARIVTEAITRPGDPRASAPAIWDASIERHGSIDPLLGELQSRIASSPEGDARRLSAIRLAARLLRRLGDLSPALEMLERIPAGAATVTDRLSEAEILDALGRNEQALEAYAGLLGSPLEPSLRNRILLRRALMGRRGAGARADEGPSPLALFAAEEGRDPELRDQAAIVLALLDGQKEAIDLFTPEGEGTERFRQDVRLAEWALEAEEWRRAQEFAWSACRAAALGREAYLKIDLSGEGAPKSPWRGARSASGDKVSDAPGG